jgi:hypothetical protein
MQLNQVQDKSSGLADRTFSASNYFAPGGRSATMPAAFLMHVTITLLQTVFLTIRGGDAIAV